MSYTEDLREINPTFYANNNLKMERFNMESQDFMELITAKWATHKQHSQIIPLQGLEQVGDSAL